MRRPPPPAMPFRPRAEHILTLDPVAAGHLDQAAAFVVGLLADPGADIRVHEGQLGLAEDVVVPGHPDGFELRSLLPVDPGTVWAIDGGSSVVADGRSFQVVAYRAARVRFRGGRTDLVESPPLSMRGTSPDSMVALAREALTELLGSEPDHLPEPTRPIDALREWSEWRLVKDTIERAEAGTLVLVDGSLHGGPMIPPAVVSGVHRTAVDRGVSLAGVVKASTLYWGRNAPLVTLLKRRADRELGPVPWSTQISTDPVFGRLYPGEIFVAHLASTATHAFRVDVARGPAPPEDVLARLAGLADDPAFVGYPYPLARAHQAARVTGYQVVDVRREFRDALSRHGMGEDDIEVLFQDFHEVLNRS